MECQPRHEVMAFSTATPSKVQRVPWRWRSLERKTVCLWWSLVEEQKDMAWYDIVWVVSFSFLYSQSTSCDIYVYIYILVYNIYIICVKTSFGRRTLSTCLFLLQQQRSEYHLKVLQQLPVQLTAGSCPSITFHTFTWESRKVDGYFMLFP